MVEEAADVLRDWDGNDAGDIGTFEAEVGLVFDLGGPGRRLLLLLLKGPTVESRLLGAALLDLPDLRPSSGVDWSCSAGEMASLCPWKDVSPSSSLLVSMLSALGKAVSSVRCFFLRGPAE